jgi:hypothetical protein
MYDTREIISQKDYPRSLSTCPALTASLRLDPRDSQGAMGWRRTRALRRNGPLTMSPACGAPRPFAPALICSGLLIANAFSARVLAKIMFGRRLSYHVLQIPAQHKSIARQKIPRAPGFLSNLKVWPGVRRDLFCPPVAAALPPVWEAGAHRCSGISCHFGFHDLSIPKKEHLYV